LENQKLYLAFAELDGSVDACLEFARAWGLLTQMPKAGAAEPLSLWRTEIKRLKWGLNNAVPRRFKSANSRRLSIPVGQLNVELISRDPGRRPLLWIEPASLLDSMRWQFAQARANGASGRACAQCGKSFEVSTHGKRVMSRFCSDPCRNRHHYDRNR
jgi:hypothetical protein